MIKKVVIPAAGLGTRLLPITKELPKEMLPVFSRQNNEVCLKPMLQAVFDQLYDVGFREFCIIVGRGKRAIEDHFTPDWTFVENLKRARKASLVCELEDFYTKITASTIVFVNQPEPKGFGDAVLKAESFTGNDPFLVHAGDNLVLSTDNDHLVGLIKVFEELNADAILLVQKVVDARMYGVVEGGAISEGIYRVEAMVEKPVEPRSNIAAIAVYVFKPRIYDEIERLRLEEAGEIELTDAIQGLIDHGGRVYAMELKNEKRVDIGTSERYWKALSTTRGHCISTLATTFE
jgi:UTP--glucose-1-phosphate uridylyltransferase